MLRSLVYAQHTYDLLDYLRWRTSVPIELNEMAISVTGRFVFASRIAVAMAIAVPLGARRRLNEYNLLSKMYAAIRTVLGHLR
jgi:hypothetical protein